MAATALLLWLAPLVRVGLDVAIARHSGDASREIGKQLMAVLERRRKQFLSTAKSFLIPNRWRLLLGLLCLALAPCFALAVWAGVGGNISGTVRDASGAVVSKAAVAATNTDTGARQTVTTDDKGFYSFLNLPIGHYDIGVTLTGFKPSKRSGIVLDVNSSLLID